MKIRSNWPELLLLLLAFGLMVLAVTDLRFNFVHNEAYVFLERYALKSGPEFHFWNDISRLFDVSLDGWCARPRFYNWYAWVINTKVRYWLFQNVSTPLPSISVVWIINIFILPILLFRFLMLVTRDNRRASLLGTAYMVTSIGFLSTMTMYFHAGKPMSLLGLIACCFQIARMQRRDETERLKINSFIILFLIILASMFWDEFYYIFFLAAPILFFTHVKKYRKSYFAVAGTAFMVFVIVTFYVAPHLSKTFGQHFDFLQFAFQSNDSLRSLHFPHFLKNVWNSFAVQTGFYFDFNYIRRVRFKIKYEWILPAILLLTFAKAAIGSSSGQRSTYRRCLAALGVFFLFQELILTRRDGSLIAGAFYLGIPFSFFFGLMFTSWINLKSNGQQRMISLGLCLVFCICGYWNSAGASAEHQFINLRLYPQIAKLNMRSEGKYSYQLIRQVWAHKDDLDEVKRLLVGQPRNAAWLYYEAYKHVHQGRVADPNWGL